MNFPTLYHVWTLQRESHLNVYLLFALLSYVPPPINSHRPIFMTQQNGRSSLGDALYRNITEEDFDAEAFLESADLSTEHKILDLKDRIEASVVIWKRKMHNKDVKSSWVSAVSWGKREQFEDRAETILLILKHRFPGIPQSQLDISKIQYNKVFLPTTRMNVISSLKIFYSLYVRTYRMWATLSSKATRGF